MSSDPYLGKLFGNVRLTERIGQGAMGMVYKAWHERLGRDVAVKILLDSGRKNARERFLREAQSSAKVRHPNVVQVLDAGEHLGTAYLVMELVDGHSLGSIVDDSGPLLPDVVARLARGIAHGLDAIHQCGIIHRDIKPDNILVGADGVPKITDLGLAKTQDDPDLLRLTATGVVVGTPLYVSPESIRDPKSITPATDIYSLGATLYHLLVGKPPFDSDSSYEVMRAQLEAKPRPIREIKPEVPVGLAKLVERCLEKQVNRRPTVKEIAAQLDQGARLQPGADRGLMLAIILAVLAVLALALGGWRWLSRPPIPETPAAADAALNLQASHAQARVRIDQGTWRPLAKEPLRLSSGFHVIEVAADQPGPLLSWRGEVTMQAGQVLDQSAPLATTPVSDTVIKAPGPGMVYVDGTAYGLEPTVVLRLAGTYALGTWNGSTWASSSVTLTSEGKSTVIAASGSDRPGGPAWWCTLDDANRRCDPHHVLSWWEAERLRADAKMPASPEWTSQGRRPEQPALALSSGLVHAVRAWLTTVHMRLPQGEQARHLAALYHTGIWSVDGERLDVIGGPTSTAQLVLVPRKAD